MITCQITIAGNTDRNSEANLKCPLHYFSVQRFTLGVDLFFGKQV